jgi:hypothetical protein
MKWNEKREEIQKKFDDLAQQNVQGLITELNQAVGNYIANGGLSQDPNNNPTYNRIIDLTNRAENIKQRYILLNEEMIRFISEQSNAHDLGVLLRENGELQKQINKLEKIKDEMKIDVVSAVARDELLRSRNTDVTKHQLFLLDRPVKEKMIPYLWVLSILFIGVGLVIFKMTMPVLPIGQANGATSILSLVKDFFSNKVVLVSLLVSALIVILFLSLKIAGVFGK